MQVIEQRQVGQVTAGGFSLTELIASLTVLGVLLTIAGPRFGEYLRTNGFEVSVGTITITQQGSNRSATIAIAPLAGSVTYV